MMISHEAKTLAKVVIRSRSPSPSDEKTQMQKILDQKNYIHLPSKFIQQRADEEGVTFDEMLKIIEDELKPKQR